MLNDSIEYFSFKISLTAVFPTPALPIKKKYFLSFIDSLSKNKKSLCLFLQQLLEAIHRCNK